jgi:hypothetical protein
MNQASPLQSVIESVEALSEEERDILYDFIHKRRIDQRRQEILKNGVEAVEAAKNGTAQRGTAEEIMADLLGDDTECGS